MSLFERRRTIIRTKKLIALVLVLLGLLSLGLTYDHSEIVYYTEAYNAFTGWDIFLDRTTQLSMASPKDGLLTNGGLKIQPVNPDNPTPWRAAEYFCDPDSVIVVSSPDRYEVAYTPYLKWDKDFFLRNDHKFARISYKYKPLNDLDPVIKQIPNQKNSPLKLDIRQDHTLEVGKNWVKNTIYITNRYPDAIGLLYIYQDAAYMWFPDGNQSKVKPLVTYHQVANSVDQYYFGQNNSTDMVAATYHTEKGVVAGLTTSNPYAYLGVIPEYALFGRHVPNEQINFGYADMDNNPKSFSEIITYLQTWNGLETTPDKLKVRVVAFPINNIEPGQTAAIQYWSLGLKEQSLVFSDLVTSINDVSRTIR